MHLKLELLLVNILALARQDVERVLPTGIALAHYSDCITGAGDGDIPKTWLA